MGIRGLQTFMEKNGCQDKFDIARRAEEYRLKNKKKPVILVDVASCLTHLYCHENLDWIMGGQYQDFVDIIKSFVKAFNKIGVQLVLVYDGLPVLRKHAEWVRRRLDGIGNVYKIFNHLKNGNWIQAMSCDIILPPCAWLILRSLLNSMSECQHYTAIREADDDIAGYAKKNGCFAILGQDTDFVIMEGSVYYLSIKSLNINTMTTINYNRNSLAALLNIDTKLLPLFATLCGNDVIGASELSSFHSTIGESNGWKKFFSVAKYMKRMDFRMDRLDMVNLGPLSRFDWTHKLKTSVDSYAGVTEPEPDIGICSQQWREIVRVARQRHISCLAPIYIYNVILREPFYLNLVAEDFRVADIPPCQVALRKMRGRLYGVLLKESPRNLDPVTEWVMAGPDSLKEPTMVIPVLPEKSPGLLNLWGSSLDYAYERWYLLCWIVSSLLEPDSILSLNSCFVVPVLSLYYMYHEVDKKFLLEWELEVLLAQAVRIQITPKLPTEVLKAEPVTDPRALHLMSFFQRTCHHVEIAVAACGFPVSELECQAFHYINGKLYNYTYGQAKRGAKGEVLCGNTATNVEAFNMMKTIICGGN